MQVHYSASGSITRIKRVTALFHKLILISTIGGINSTQSGILNPGLATTQTVTQTQATTSQTVVNQGAARESYIERVGEVQTLAPVLVSEFVEYQPIVHRVIEVPQIQRYEKHTFVRISNEWVKQPFGVVHQ